MQCYNEILQPLTAWSDDLHPILHRTISNGAGTNLIVGLHVRRKAPEFFVVSIHFFGFTIAISRCGKRFRDCQYSLVSFLLFAVLLLTVSPCAVMWNYSRQWHRSIAVHCIH